MANQKPPACPAHGTRTTWRWRYAGLAVGVGLGLGVVGVASFPERSSLTAAGPMNTGHEGLACRECHTPAPGTAAQQVSSNIHYWLGLRRTAFGFGSRKVGSADCLACHEREGDLHPISRFLEPRFAEARRSIPAHECLACHTEHEGKRVTLGEIGYCRLCHQDIELADDPIGPAHAELARAGSWNLCLRCHDFHGNHLRTTPDRLEEGITEEQVRGYFAGRPSPYSADRAARALGTRRERAR